MTPTHNIAEAERLGREYEISCGRSGESWYAYGFGTLAEMYRADVERLEEDLESVSDRLRTCLDRLAEAKGKLSQIQVRSSTCLPSFSEAVDRNRDIHAIARDAVELSVKK